MEEWREAYPGYYEVSDLGNIRSMDRLVDHWRGGRLLRKSQPIKPTLNSKGYLTVVICIEGTRCTETVHRLVATAFLANPLSLPQVNHEDGDKLNCKASNLTWSSPGDNQRHAYNTGLKGRGENSGVAILTEILVRQIREAFDEGLNYSQIGKKFAINPATVRQVVLRNTWAHVA
jgi:hypothetical protein